MLETEEPAAFHVYGHKIELSEGRSVWAGKHDNSWFIQFHSREGQIRKLRISYEAGEALVNLLTSKPAAIFRYILHVDPVDAVMKWQAMDSTDQSMGSE